MTPPAPPDARPDRRLLWAVGVLTALASLATAWHYDAAGLALSHYDAKGHLVVARRIFDSLTPGWRQIGAVWLPLPHLLNALPSQVDAWYRTGASAILLSMACFVFTSVTLARLVTAATGSLAGAAAAVIVFASDPNVLYLQSTPMTEPLLFACLAAAALATYRWVESGGAHGAVRAGLWMSAACWTRYEAWPVTAALLALGTLILAIDLRSPAEALRRGLRLAAWPIGAILLFTVHSRATIGEWFTTGGFFVPENKALGKPWLAASQVVWGLIAVVGQWPVVIAALGIAATLVAALRQPSRRALLVALALAGTAALPFYAFVSGHPFRIRYMIVLAVALSAWNGVAVASLPRRLRGLGVALVAVAALWDASPWAATAPMVREAQWDRPNITARRVITDCLVRGFERPDHKILASMGSLAHYMQELSADGFALDDFVHEGIGDLWGQFLLRPSRHVEWVLFNEYSEGGDELTKLRTAPGSTFADGFTRVCEGAGLALYRRDPVGQARHLDTAPD